MFAPYRTILSLPGSLSFAATGWFARLPMSMIGIGLVLLVSSATGSYGLAGSVSAACVIAAAATAPLQARLTDRYGQHRMLPILAGLNAVAMGALVVAVRAAAPTPVPLTLSAVAGATSPLVGSLIRARWTHALEGRPELQTAFALEALLDEVVFMVGPPLVTLLATAVSPVAGLATAVSAGLVGSLLLAAQRRTQPPVHPARSGRRDKPKLGWSCLGPIIVACAGLGILFGGAEVVVVAVASEAGHRAIAGLLLAGWATGSMLAALVIGTLRLRMPPMRRLRIGATVLAATIVPLPFIGDLGVLGAVLFLAGFAISPTLVATMAVVERAVPSSRLTEGLAWTFTGMAGGVAAGAALAGQVVDAAGGRTGFYVPLAAASLTALVTYLGRPPGPRSAERVERAERFGEPVVRKNPEPKPAPGSMSDGSASATSASERQKPTQPVAMSTARCLASPSRARRD
ncbi:MAG TPA: MFS transporter [Actinopolymorphaceae bacterium]|nr:MFS transporter [Actinopolymorphaceae bacterium]